MVDNSEYNNYPFKLNLSLVNHFRTFQNDNHEFSPLFLETVFAHLRNFKATNPGFLKIEEKLKAEENLSVDHLILILHFYFGSIANLDEFCKAANSVVSVASLSKSHINKTNILNIHPIADCLRKLDSEAYKKAEGAAKSEFLDNYTFVLAALPDDKKLTYVSKDSTVLALDLELIILGIKSKGKLDPYLVSYICSRINTKHNLQLFTILFAMIQPKKELISSYSQVYADVAISILDQNKRFSFTKSKFDAYQKKLVHYQALNPEKPLEVLHALLQDIETDLCQSLIESNTEILNYIETLLIAMLGHPEIIIRDAAVQYLNVLYDGIDWQLRKSFKPKVASVGDKFKIDYLIEAHEEESNSIVLLLNSRAFCQGSNETIITWHKPKLTPYKSSIQIEGSSFMIVSMDLGKFKKCGYYDWKLVRMEKSGKIKGLYKVSNMEDLKSSANLSLSHSSFNDSPEKNKANIEKSRPVQGRFIIHPEYARSLQIHEVFVDFQEAVPDPTSGKLVRRGNFLKVKDNMKRYRDSGINCMYLMGALERDNGPQFIKETYQKTFKRPDASPLAVICRKTPNSMLGGVEGFKELVGESKKLGMRILIDGLTRVSSARPHKRYLDHVLHNLDESGKKTICFGTDGRALNFEDTALLNYRKKEVWDLFLKEVIEFTDKFGIDGIHLDNGQAWPQIMQLDVDEMYRTDCDGTPAYTDQDIFNGTVVLPNENCGYWGSNMHSKYPNPFMVKLCKTFWSHYKDFLILAESMTATGFEGREINIIKSGPIPRVYNLPYALASIFGQKLHPDGTITYCEKKNANVFRSWYENIRKNQPAGSIVAQSTTSHSWPYPALLYKRGTWAAVDLIFFLPDLPMTFIGEQDGHAFRTKTTNIFTKVVVKDKEIESERKLRRIETADLKEDSMNLNKPRKSTGGMKSEIQEAVKMFAADENDVLQAKAVVEKKDVVGNMIRVASGVSISELAAQHIHQAETSLQMEIGPHFGFDLKKIREHYEHRRYLRATKEVLRNGKLVALSAEHDLGWHTHVLAFARYTGKQIAIIAINFNDSPVHVYLNLKNLKFLFKNYESSDMVVKLEDWLAKEEKSDHFTVAELINDRHYAYINTYGSILWGVTMYDDSTGLQKICLERAVKRLNTKIENVQTIYSNEIAIMLSNVLKSSKRLQDFVNGFSFYYEHYIRPNDIDIVKLVGLIRDIRDDPVLIGKFFAIFRAITEMKAKFPETFKDVPAVNCAEPLLDSKKLGTIAFCTPELGRWSTVGGLGVMVDELSQGLAMLGERVVMVSPYYARNRKGETDYLAKDPIKIVHKLNFDIWAGGFKYIIGVHEGTANGVQYYFLHNPEIFPHPYPDGDAAFTLRQLVVFARGCLELFCQTRDLPKLIVTNDWFCGLLPGYAKCRVFGDVFDQTKFFHIVHNLDPMYEGRCYPKPEEGTLHHVHELPDDILVDPYWEKKVINPSRCALLLSDQWGTVSQAYRQDLLNTSPLASVLAKHPKPFGFPNGIPKALRLNKLKEVCNNDHLAAKKKIQQKYFNFNDLDNSVCLLAFVGRITQQKGVHLICEMMDELMAKFGGKVQVMIGGMANLKDPYGGFCAGLIWNLRNKYPYNFWANPTEFFTDGTLINSGADFGLMPSLFEPGGIVQHEFFVAGTPVIAFKTGGLKDTVFEFDPKTKKGNGFNFQEHRYGELLWAVDRAISVYPDAKLYDQLRRNAFDSVIDVADVSRAWDKEFHRLFGKLFVDGEVCDNQYNILDKAWDPKNFKEVNSFQKTKGAIMSEEDEVMLNFEKVLVAAKKANYKKFVFKISVNRLPRPKIVQIIGTWDDWKAKHNLLYDYFSQTWTITMSLSPGEYFYKYIVDGEWICNENDPKNNDIYGNINNYLVL